MSSILELMKTILKFDYVKVNVACAGKLSLEYLNVLQFGTRSRYPPLVATKLYCFGSASGSSVNGKID